MRPIPVDDGDAPAGRETDRRQIVAAPPVRVAAATRLQRPVLTLVEAAPDAHSLVVDLDLRSITDSGADIFEPGGTEVPTADLEAGDGGTAGAGQTPEQHRVAALLRLAQRGDGEAFGRIYDRYVDQVYRYLYYRVGSHAVAEDLTSETFLRALRRIGSFSWQGRDIGAWFITIARNLVNDHVKSSRFRLEIPTGDMLDADHGDDGIEQTVIDRLQGAAVIDAIRELKSDHQECLVLRFLQGLSVAETAEVMNRSEGAIKQLQLRAVRALARVLTRRGDRPPERNPLPGASLSGRAKPLGPGEGTGVRQGAAADEEGYGVTS